MFSTKTSHSDSIKGNFFNGNNSLCQPCVLHVDTNGCVKIHGAECNNYQFFEIQLSPRIGSTTRTLYFPDGTFFESRDNETIDSIIKHHNGNSVSRHIYQMESKLRFAVLAAILFTLTLVGILNYGLPAISGYIANSLPRETSIKLASESQRYLDQFIFEPSELNIERQKQISNLFERHAPFDDLFDYRIYFRKGGIIGANAFALPDGRVIVTDELVQLSKNDVEILSVLFHEIGHIQKRHTLRRVIQGTGALVIFAWLIGDAEALVDWTAGLPTYLMQKNYSRRHEYEADTHSIELMLENKLDPIHFVNFMQRIIRNSECKKSQTTDFEDDHCISPSTENEVANKKNTESEKQSKLTILIRLLSSHPPDSERQERFLKASQKFQIENSH